MELLEALEQTAQLAVGVVDRFNRLLDAAQGMLAQLDDRRRLPVTEQTLHEIDRIVNATCVVVGAGVVDEAVDPDGLVDRASDLASIRPSRRRHRSPRE